MDTTDHLLSLAANPYNPFEDYNLWKSFDTNQGFDTNGLLARALSTSEALSDFEQEQDLIDAIDSIVNNPSFHGLYVRVSRPKI